LLLKDRPERITEVEVMIELKKHSKDLALYRYVIPEVLFAHVEINFSLDERYRELLR